MRKLMHQVTTAREHVNICINNSVTCKSSSAQVELDLADGLLKKGIIALESRSLGDIVLF